MGRIKIYTVAIIASMLAIIVMLPIGCSKTGYTVVKTTIDSSSQIITGNDELNVNYEFDQAVNEALLATSICRIASGDTSIAGTSATELNTTISKVTIDTSHISDSALIHLNYYGKNADQTKGRTGTLTVHCPRDINGKIIPWKTPGASLSITFDQYEVTLLSNNLSIWMNGTATLTNTSGGVLKTPANITIPTGDSLTDKVSAAITFTYNDNVSVIQTWTWNMNQARAFSLQSGALTSSIKGDTTISGLSNISTSGTTRFGFSFYTQCTSPIVQTISSSFILSKPLSGQKIVRGIQEPMTINYGVDTHGNPVSSAPYGFKINWISNGTQAQTVVPY